jgi:hypothetical protein
MRHWLSALLVVAVSTGAALAQEDKKTDDPEACRSRHG